MADSPRPTMTTWNRRSWLDWVLLFGVFTLIGLIFSIQIYLGYAHMENAPRWREALLGQMPFWWLCALFYPPVRYLARRYPIAGGGWLRHSGLHFTMSLGFAFVHSILYMVCILLFEPATFEKPVVSASEFFQHLSKLNFALRIVGYFLILAGVQALDYYRRYEEGSLRASQLKAQLAQAQLQALRMQLHPHFLFNTLNSISALLHSDPEGADRMIARLGDFLRITLQDFERHQVRLQDEVGFLKNYLEIERVRFRDRLEVELAIDPETLDALVPNLVWQPVVENAVKHGIAPRSAPGRILITSRRIRDRLELTVQDNGPGLPPAKPGHPLTLGVGLSNTRSRLRQLYGDSFSCGLRNRLEGGVSAVLNIPFEKAEQPLDERTHAAKREVSIA
ncbi:MAG: histidine kinase [Acidobacteriota bacterium]